VIDAEVVIVGAGPAGLMLACELRLGGVGALVLERQPRLGDVPKANGFSGQILDVMRHRGLLERVEAVGNGPVHPAPAIPFGGLHLDLAPLDGSNPLRALALPQRRLEQVLGERAGELGAEVRRGHEVTGVRQDEATVTAGVLGPDGPYPVTGRYLVGCDGGRSRVRDQAGIAFPGVTYPEVNRLAQVWLAGSATRLDNGDLEVPGLGRVRSGFTRTEGGTFAFGWRSQGDLLVQTTEDDPGRAGDDSPMTLDEFQDSIRRVLGTELPVAEVTRLSRYEFQARQAERYRDRRILLAGDAAHQFPATGIGINVGMMDAVNLGWKLAADVGGWAPAGLLDTYPAERHLAGEREMLQAQAQVALRRGQDPAAAALRELFTELIAGEQPLGRLAALIAGADVRYPLPNPGQHPLTGGFVPDLTLDHGAGSTSVAGLMTAARPVFLDLADRPELRETARDWRHRIDLRSGTTDHRPADALLIRPDACVAWAAPVDEPARTAVPALREALARWFGNPEVIA
jgi:2-polyprenyl-6-methoxyphenol hydroxylase-like FAD-dependent oxidoreductase